MLLEIFRVRLLAAMVVHVARDRALEVVVELSPTLVGGRSLIVLPGGVIVGLVLPFDLLHSSQPQAAFESVEVAYQIFEILLLSEHRVKVCDLLAYGNDQPQTTYLDLSGGDRGSCL